MELDTTDGRTRYRFNEDDSYYSLKPKIVATLGSPDSYPEGITQEDGSKFEIITYPSLVKAFYDKGVDVIRLNFSHITLEKINQIFTEIKTFLLDCENKNPTKKKIALLVDLEGPKIRASLSNHSFQIGNNFTIHFEEDETVKNDPNAATVYADGKPLRQTLSTAIGRRISIPHEVLSSYSSEDIENALGPQFVQNSIHQNPYQEMMQQIDSERPLIILGDGDVFLELDRDFDPNGTTLPCIVTSVKDPKKIFSKSAGFTLKGIEINLPTFTVNDEKKLGKLLKLDYQDKNSEPVVTFVALSFTQTADDVLRTSHFIEQNLLHHGIESDAVRYKSPSIIAKIETTKGLANIGYILDVADGIMVARGDYGLHSEIEEVPAAQKKLIRLCNMRGKPVITATQMLLSMTSNKEPTRAESTDVFNAIIDGSDSVMLSEEAAQGRFPFDAIRKMLLIAAHAEIYQEKPSEIEFRGRRSTDRLYRLQNFLNDDLDTVKENTERLLKLMNLTNLATVLNKKDVVEMLQWRSQLYTEKWRRSLKQSTTELITAATCTLGESKETKGIVAASTSGRTVRMISRFRPMRPLIGAAHDGINTRKLALSYGAIPICVDEAKRGESTDNLWDKCREKILSNDFLRETLGDDGSVVFTVGTKIKEPGTTDQIQIRKIHEDE